MGAVLNASHGKDEKHPGVRGHDSNNIIETLKVLDTYLLVDGAPPA